MPVNILHSVSSAKILLLTFSSPRRIPVAKTVQQTLPAGTASPSVIGLPISGQKARQGDLLIPPQNLFRESGRGYVRASAVEDSVPSQMESLDFFAPVAVFKLFRIQSFVAKQDARFVTSASKF